MTVLSNQLNEMGIAIKSDMLQKDIETILTTDQNVTEFIASFLTTPERIYFDVQDYRQHLIAQSTPEFNQFASEYASNPISALTNLFKHYIQDEEVNMINQRIEQEKFTLKGLYDKFISKPQYRAQRIMLIAKG
ncbi:hypothetical protein Q9251_02865 [Alkalihalobacillus macyae]|uniref:hypothetical protein n=1 Tax=Guptibacillus hwajinpoensis TaxID=208199 RepID=UPI00273B70ED|nr:hypothetical protein [Alkalihalobacillus macyae]MDP4549816.1 hypothetical protein [Alkalihalobacillus macyae]